MIFPTLSGMHKFQTIFKNILKLIASVSTENYNKLLVFLICKSLWIKASAKLINVNVKNNNRTSFIPGLVLFGCGKFISLELIVWIVDLCWANINIATVFLLYVCVCVLQAIKSAAHTVGVWERHQVQTQFCRALRGYTRCLSLRSHRWKSAHTRLLNLA